MSKKTWQKTGKGCFQLAVQKKKFIFSNLHLMCFWLERFLFKKIFLCIGINFKVFFSLVAF